MSCVPESCVPPGSTNKEFSYPTIQNASNYINLKKNRVLFKQYKEKHSSAIICNTSMPHASYTSYEQRQNVKRGCWMNEFVCLKKCKNFKSPIG